MANTKISNLTALAEAPATNDLLALVDVSASETKKLTVANLIDSVEGNANTFTAAQTVNVATNPLTVQVSGATMWQTESSTTQGRRLALAEFDNDTGVGRCILLSRNTNASTPAAGFLQMVDNGNTNRRLWFDSSGNLRMHTANPTNANDTAGTVIGTQTSWHELKEAITEWSGEEALDAIRALTLYSYQMIEDGQKTPNGEKPIYYGIVITDEDREANAWFGLGYAENQIPALNDRNLFGYMLAAIRHGGDIIEALQAQVALLEERVTALEA